MTFHKRLHTGPERLPHRLNTYAFCFDLSAATSPASGLEG